MLYQVLHAHEQGRQWQLMVVPQEVRLRQLLLPCVPLQDTTVVTRRSFVLCNAGTLALAVTAAATAAAHVQCCCCLVRLWITDQQHA